MSSLTCSSWSLSSPNASMIKPDKWQNYWCLNLTNDKVIEDQTWQRTYLSMIKHNKWPNLLTWPNLSKIKHDKWQSYWWSSLTNDKVIKDQPWQIKNLMMIKHNKWQIYRWSSLTKDKFIQMYLQAHCKWQSYPKYFFAESTGKKTCLYTPKKKIQVRAGKARSFFIRTSELSYQTDSTLIYRKIQTYI